MEKLHHSASPRFWENTEFKTVEDEMRIEMKDQTRRVVPRGPCKLGKESKARFALSARLRRGPASPSKWTIGKREVVFECLGN